MKSIRTLTAYALTALILVIVAASAGCGAKNKDYATTLAVLNAHRDVWLKYDAQHELDLAKSAPDMPTFTAQFDAYHKLRQKVDAAFRAAYDALDVAVKSNGTTDLVEKEASVAYALLAEMGVLP